MDPTINSIVNDAILQWAALTGAHPEDVAPGRTLGEYLARKDLSREAKAVNESRELDPTGVSTFMLLRSFADRYSRDLSITAKEFLADPQAAIKQMQALKALLDCLNHPLAMEAVDEFREKLREAAAHYGVSGDDLQEFHKVLADDDLLAVIRRDALRSLETLEAHQFTQGDPDGTTLGMSPRIYEFWNIGNLLRAAMGMKIPGIALCLVRDPVSEFFNFFTIVVRNGSTVTVLTDRDKHPHPQFRQMIMDRRPDRDFTDRAQRHWFPYHLMDTVKVSADQKRLYVAQETALAPVNDQAMVIGHVNAIYPACFIWLVLVFDLVQERYGKQHHLLPETSYVAEMIEKPDLLVGAGSELATRGGYQPLEVVPFKAVQKDQFIRLRCTVEQKRILTEAAEADGLGVSGWLLHLGLREAQRPRS